MSDFTVLNHLQIGITDVTELFFFYYDFTAGLWAGDSDLLRRFADWVIWDYLFELKGMLRVEQFEICWENLDADLVFGRPLDVQISIFCKFHFGLNCFFILSLVRRWVFESLQYVLEENAPFLDRMFGIFSSSSLS